MKPVNIYALTRISDTAKLERLERQMSKRNRYLKIKEWEIEGLKAFSDRLNCVMKDAPELTFYYSFTMPKLGKEFDLLRVNDDFVVNVELKSGNVTDDIIRKQLQQNRYYLSTLGRNMYFYTYISRQDRLVRLSNSGRLVDTEWDELASVLERQEDIFDGHIEELFKEDKYLISPLTDPGRFLRQEYFLTLQQKDIRKAILKNIRNKDGSIKRDYSVQGFTGLPGTGKTILLYDIAMQLSKGQRVCVLHFGSHEKELEQLDERLKRVDFYYCDGMLDTIICKDDINESSCGQIESKDNGKILMLNNLYSAILVDEGHRVNESSLSTILELAYKWQAPVIFSYDREDAIAKEEREVYGAELIEDIPGYVKYKLTNRIRMNSELSTFISCVMCIQGRNYRRDYPSVSLVYANDDNEAEILLQSFERDGYIYIWNDERAGFYNKSYNNASSNDTKCSDINSKNIDNNHDIEIADDYKQIDIMNPLTSIEASAATCKEFDRVVMMIDDAFYYDDKGYLRYKEIERTNIDAISTFEQNADSVIRNDGRSGNDYNSCVRNLYHGLSRAKKNIAIVVKDNWEVFEALLGILQR